jgi:methyl-accepting chemotaxis protein
MDHDLAPLRRTVDRALIPALWLHVPLIVWLCWRTDGPAMSLGGTAVAIAALATAAWATMAEAPTTRPIIAVGAIGMVSLVLASARGGAWQMDVHMYYFSVLAMLAAYCDVVVILAAAAAIVAHHLTLNFIAPALVFPDGADFARVLLHTVIVMVEAAALAFMSLQVSRLFASVNQGRATA